MIWCEHDKSRLRRLALGTAQFGMVYGISNQDGQVGHQEVASIMRHAKAAGMDTLDTAMAYGDSELCLGSIGLTGWRVITKLPSFLETCRDITAWVRKEVEDSLVRLNISCLAGLLLHAPMQLLKPEGTALFKALVQLREQRMVEKIGFSIYSPDELDALWQDFRPDLIQSPLNVLDRRLVSSGWLKRLQAAGIEVHVRSLFLQGLLLMKPSARPEKFKRWQPLWEHWAAWLDEQNLSPITVCVGYAMSMPELSRIIVGVDSKQQLDEILLAVAKQSPVLPPDALAVEDIDLITPSHWNRL
ncbi:MAG: hypothetical protein A2X46_04910 [Lentisphaerae bacterium GWF2_57_35]|nr:MAG: hypothetical protein A2X46_04910 [Lentisphaerae bacterium GWF2_57_35]